MRNTIKKIFFLLPSGDKYKVAILFVLMLGAACLEVLGIGMIPLFVSAVATPELILEKEFLQNVLAWLKIETDKDLLIWGSASLVAVFILKGIYTVIFAYIEARFIFSRRYIMSNRLMSIYMQAPYEFHIGRNTAELLRNITQEIRIIVNSVLTGVLEISKELLMTVTIILFLFIVEPLITLIVIILSGVGAGFFLLATQKKVRLYGVQEQGHRKDMIKAVNQGLGGLKEARVLNREKELIEKFRIEAYESTKLMAYMRYIRQVPKPVIESIAVLTMMIISAMMVWQGRPMGTIIPILTLFAMATVRLMPSVQKLSSLFTSLSYNIVALDPIYEDFKKLESYRKEFVKDRKMNDRIFLSESIKAKNIYYSYPESDEEALKDITFDIPKGKLVGFVGESGAGKTTIVDLLLGLLKPKSGSVCVDGKNIQDYLAAWQKNIGYIPQSIYLADETVRNNVAFGLPEKEIDDAKVWNALELAQLKKMISNMTKGLDTIIGEHGTRISGGQRQRIGIARALYHNPQVLVMDEATSALDNVTEKEITNAIEHLKGDRTIIVIAHRLSTVENCDMLYLLKNGKIVDQGNYNNLIENNHEFRKMALVE